MRATQRDRSSSNKSVCCSTCKINIGSSSKKKCQRCKINIICETCWGNSKHCCILKPILNTEINDINLNSNKRIYQLLEYNNRFTENDKLQIEEQKDFLKIDNYEGRDPRLIDEIACIPAEVFENAFDGSYRIIWKINEHLILVEALSKEYLDDLKFKGLLWIKGCRKLNVKEKKELEMETRREANEREELKRDAKERE